MSEKPIGEPKWSGKNLRDIPIFLPIAGYGVAEWTPQDDGKGKPEAVMLHFEMAQEFDGVEFGLRLKSAAEVNRMVTLLRQYRDMVWPSQPARGSRGGRK